MPYVPFLSGQKMTALLLNTRIIEEIMEWTALDTIGSFAGIASPGAVTPMMRKLRVMGEEVWEFKGRINISALTAATTTSLITMNTGYRVSAEHGFSVYGAGTAHYPVRLGFMTSGTITASVPTAAGAGTSAVWLDGVIVIDPT